MVSAPYSKTINTTVTRIVDYSPNRTVVMMFNNSGSVVYLGTGAELSKDNGFPLQPSQGIVLAREFGDDPTLSYYGVVESGTAEIRVWEGYGETIGYLLDKIKEILQR